jgi:uncharacterized protein (TIGR01244 family)
MKSTRLAPALTISPQLAPEDFAVLAAEGVCLVINNRPVGVAPGQLSAAEAARHAAAAGIAYRHIPITLPALSHDDILAFRAAVREAGGAVHAHCRSGARSASLWLLGEILDGAMTRDEARAFAAERGMSLQDALAWLDRHEAAAGRR